jgi:hypothetical protein
MVSINCLKLLLQLWLPHECGRLSSRRAAAASASCITFAPARQSLRVRLLTGLLPAVKLPAGHALHCCGPGCCLKVFAGHTLQLVLPADVCSCWPGGHPAVRSSNQKTLKPSRH